MFDEVLVPTAVYDEVVIKGAGRPGAVLAGLLSKEEALDALQRLVDGGIRISPRWQTWLKNESKG